MVQIANKSVTSILALADVADTIQLGLPCNTVQVYNKSLTANLYVRVDGIDPVASGDGSFYVGPNTSRLFPVFDTTFPEIRVISDATPTSYIVECFQ